MDVKADPSCLWNAFDGPYKKPSCILHVCNCWKFSATAWSVFLSWMPSSIFFYLFYWTCEHKEWVCLFHSKHINSTVHSIPTRFSALWQQQESKGSPVSHVLKDLPQFIHPKKPKTKHWVNLDVSKLWLLSVLFTSYTIYAFYFFIIY